MTQQDKDREAFEAFVRRGAAPGQSFLERDGLGHYVLGVARGGWAAWQASREHNAPTLLPLKDIELANAAKAYGCGTADNLQTLAVVKALQAIGALSGRNLPEAEGNQANRFLAWAPHMPECSIRHGNGKFGCDCGLAVLPELVASCDLEKTKEGA